MKSLFCYKEFGPYIAENGEPVKDLSKGYDQFGVYKSSSRYTFSVLDIYVFGCEEKQASKS